MTGGSLRFDLKWWRLTLSELRFTKLVRLFNVCLRQHKIRKLKRIMALAELPLTKQAVSLIKRAAGITRPHAPIPGRPPKSQISA